MLDITTQSEIEVPQPPKFEEVVKDYIETRQKIKDIEDAHDKNPVRLKLVARQNLLTEWFLEQLKKSGAQSVKTENGTVYAKTKTTASLADPQAFMDFVRDTGKFELLDRKANAIAVRGYVEEHDALPPGVNLSATSTIGVRRSS